MNSRKLISLPNVADCAKDCALKPAPRRDQGWDQTMASQVKSLLYGQSNELILSDCVAQIFLKL